MEFNLNNNLVKFLIVAVVLIGVVAFAFILGLFDPAIQNKISYTSQIETGKKINFEEICSGSMGNYETKKRAYIIMDNENLYTVAPKITTFDGNVSSLCGEVDFEKNTVVGASLGYSVVGGGQRYVKVLDVIETSDKIFVVLFNYDFANIVNSGGAAVTQASGHPFSLYKINKTNKEIIFVE